MYKQSILKLESPLFIVLKGEVLISDVALVALITFLYVIPNMAILGLLLRNILCLDIPCKEKSRVKRQYGTSLI